ncbi:hypothetical protein Bca52824_074257 [Brassica carinata]|uniref:Uncharacterized protein n=1 Tax=Brassica carinata TaxID=52824 RepID=A0A8X7QCT7_BRACI|nr:hypothetical protein Bca52824_074257 [Brassica carinata]
MVRLVFRLYTQVRLNDLHRQYHGLHQSFLWLRPPGIVHHLSVPTGMLTLEPFSEDQGRSAVHPRGIQPISFLTPYGFTSPADSHTCQTPWSVFQDGSNGEPTGRRPEHADAEARRGGACCRPRLRQRRLRGRNESPA